MVILRKQAYPYISTLHHFHFVKLLANIDTAGKYSCIIRGMTKLPIDWLLVRMRYEAGQTAYRIATDLGDRPSKQGIARRAKAEGWKAGNGNSLTIAAELPIVQRAQAMTGPTKASAERIAFVLDLIGRGSSESLASSAAGISPKTLARWKQEDPQLAEQCRQARAGKLAQWVDCIDQAATRDWKAAKELLTAAPDATDFSQQQAGGITIVLNIDREDTGTVIQGN